MSGAPHNGMQRTALRAAADAEDVSFMHVDSGIIA